MKPDPGDEKRALEALETELRQDRLEDPGDDFFADMEKRVLREADQRPAPRRPWWRAGGLGRWLWRPAPVAALAGAAVVALVVVWVGGAGGPLEISSVSSPHTVSRAGDRRPAPKAPQGDAWFAELPPTEDLWAVEDKDLPALLALLSTEVGEAGDADDEPGGAAPGEPVGEQSLKALSPDELRALERLLKEQRPQKQPRQKQPRQKQPRPRPTLDQAG